MHMLEKTMGEDLAIKRGYGDLPLPFGWFAVAMSNEIAPGEVKTLAYFATEFIIWRGENGKLNAVDPYCPHMGAHRGHGGTVQGDDLKCPFHHWTFDGEGAVTGIPYSKAIPLRLQSPCEYSWPIVEDLGVVYVWYHPRRIAPMWQVATISEIQAEGWVLAETHEWVINTHLQEITENGQDYAHFGAVHGTLSPPETEYKVDGFAARSVVETEMATPRGPMIGKIDSRFFGPGQAIVRFTDITAVTVNQQTTAIDNQTTHLRWQLYHPAGISEGKLRVNQARMRDLCKQINQDLPIWNNKRYVPRPIIVQGDGPVLAYRSAFARFYDFDSTEPVSSAA
jgi:phenylpropionate dioxygenase-like ring-hydroxylating dioxygenase large terminal subunit